jgi:5-azacytidine-induced protein 1
MAVSEKIRRDTWMQEKSREIKEMTVKGLEPEIQRLLTKHKKELERMEQANAQELKRQRDVSPCYCSLVY